MYWKIHPPRPKSFPKNGDFAFVKNPRPREILRAEFSNIDILLACKRLHCAYLHHCRSMSIFSTRVFLIFALGSVSGNTVPWAVFPNPWGGGNAISQWKLSSCHCCVDCTQGVIGVETGHRGRKRGFLSLTRTPPQADYAMHIE